MTEKRFQVHSMIEGYTIGESIDLDTLKELLEIYERTDNIELLITDNGKYMTYKEVADKLNELDSENKELRLLVDSLKQQNKKFKGRLNDLGVEYYD